MLRRLLAVRLCSTWLAVLTLLCGCSLDSTPRTGTSDSQHADRASSGWKPPGAKADSASGPAADGGSANQPSDAASAASSTNDKQSQGGTTDSKGSGPSDASKPQDNPVTNTGPAPSSNTTPGASGSSPSGDAAASTPDPAAAGGGNAGNGSNGGRGPTTADPSSAAGASGAAGAEAKSIREMFIEAAIDALGGDSQGSPDGGMEPWRRSGGSAGGLSPDFVLPVLLTMRNSAVCFREVRRCVEMCVVLATDCKPCAADPECGQALKDVCGPTIGSCGAP